MIFTLKKALDVSNKFQKLLRCQMGLVADGGRLAHLDMVPWQNCGQARMASIPID